ncbi:hypothetical protein yc1106_07621 [Curvularia clavata]|uniref:Uncharacterized protein n=1 Tax=Curvularia clavata TaxID=95742 RepID=A0A9Q9DV06_CURCL|nr:hypothetical protein yc1106_07621 [Curvularia clavata]
MSFPGSYRNTGVIATKAPRQQDSSLAGSLSVTQLLPTRPWLTRQQPISAQDSFNIHHRQNLVPGAVNLKDWASDTREFNKDELSKSLAWKTLSKRCEIARKIFLCENPGYEYATRYPVPVCDDQDTDEETGSGEMVDYDPSSRSEHYVTGFARAKYHLGRLKSRLGRIKLLLIEPKRH